MEIGLLSEADVEAAVALWHEAGLTRPWNDPLADLRRALDGRSSTVLAGVEDSELIATSKPATTATAAGSTTSPCARTSGAAASARR